MNKQSRRLSTLPILSISGLWFSSLHRRPEDFTHNHTRNHTHTHTHRERAKQCVCLRSHEILARLTMHGLGSCSPYPSGYYSIHFHLCIPFPLCILFFFFPLYLRFPSILRDDGFPLPFAECWSFAFLFLFPRPAHCIMEIWWQTALVYCWGHFLSFSAEFPQLLLLVCLGSWGISAGRKSEDERGVLLFAGFHMYS